MKNIREIYQFLNEGNPDQLSRTSQKSIEKQADIFKMDVGDICVYKNIPIGIVVLLNPLTITAFNLEFRYNTYDETKKIVKHFKTSGTKRGDWHMPTVDELKKIGFSESDDPNFYEFTKNYPINTRCEIWLEKIKKGFDKLKELTNPYSINDEILKTNSWADGTKIIERTWLKNGKVHPVFNTLQYYISMPQSNFFIIDILDQTDSNSYVHNNSVAFCNTSKLLNGKYKFIKPDMLKLENLHFQENFLKK